nr:hypothetical protein [Tanacetum cinerariifolium]
MVYSYWTEHVKPDHDETQLKEEITLILLEIPELLYKLREDVRNIREELAEYIDSPIWDCPILFYDEDEEYTIQYREYIEKSLDAVTTVLPTKEPKYSLSMGYEHLSIILETESDEVTEYSAKNLVPIPSECEVASEDESECDISVQVQSSSEEVSIEEFKVYSNPFFDDDEINSDKLDPHCFNVESDFVESLLNLVMKNIDELNDECLKPGVDIDVFTNVEDDDYFPFMFVIRIVLPYLIYPEVSPLLLSAESEDTIFNPGISV